jgi:hypothetical protein
MERSMGLANVVVVAALGWAVVLIIAVIAHCRPVDWKGGMGAVRWDNKESWTSTFTAVGAMAGAILPSQTILPRETQLLSKAVYGGLSLFFGSLIVLAAFAYNATRKREEAVTTLEGETQKQLQGSVPTFFLSTGLTLWGASGQIGVLALLTDELHRQASLVPLAARLLQFFLVVVVVVLFVYAPRAVKVALENRSPNAALYAAQVKANMPVGMRAPTVITPPQRDWAML